MMAVTSYEPSRVPVVMVTVVIIDGSDRDSLPGSAPEPELLVCYDMAVSAATTPVQLAGLRACASGAPGLALLLLHGSRARGDARADSDWDFAFLADDPAAFDPDSLLAAIAEAVGADRVDLADLSSASALLRYRSARDGVVVFERESGRFQRFWLEAVDTWCDLAPILMPVYEHTLEALPR